MAETRLNSTQHGKYLSELLSDLCEVSSAQDVLVNDIKLDSRKVNKGDLFISLANSDSLGEGHIDQAIALGASAVVRVGSKTQVLVTDGGVTCVQLRGLSSVCGLIADRFFDEPSKKLVVIGVTGTNGKTSVTHYIVQLLSKNGIRAGVIGTMGVGFPGKEMTVTGYTTPDVVEVHRNLAKMLDEGASVVAMEVSSHGLEQGRVDEVSFKGAVFTNLTRDHLDYHGSMELYGQAKAKLFQVGSLEFAILNSEDMFSQKLVDVLPESCEILMYGENPGAGRQLKLISAKYDVLAQIELEMDGRSISASLPLVGRFNVMNAIAASGVLVQLGIQLDRITGLDDLAPVPGRMNIFHDTDKPSIVVDYAHTPDALENILAAVKEHCKGQILLVFGCGGDRDKGKRAQMAKVAEVFASRVIVTDDNPRTENADSIVDDIVQGFSSPRVAEIEHDRSEAIKQAFGEAGADDWVVIAGKGHESYQEIHGERFPHSDLDLAQSLLVANTSSSNVGAEGHHGGLQ